MRVEIEVSGAGGSVSIKGGRIVIASETDCVVDANAEGIHESPASSIGGRPLSGPEVEARRPFRIGDRVRISESARGEIVALARIPGAGSDPQALVDYVAGDGRRVEGWWRLDQLTPLREGD